MEAALKRYVVFVGDSCYASGGALDIAGSHPTLDEALAWLRDPSRVRDLDDCYTWCHVLDLETGRILAYNQGCYCGKLEGNSRVDEGAKNLYTGDPDNA